MKLLRVIKHKKPICFLQLSSELPIITSTSLVAQSCMIDCFGCRFTYNMYVFIGLYLIPWHLSGTISSLGSRCFHTSILFSYLKDRGELLGTHLPEIHENEDPE